jgi:hypothetical protein
VGGGYACGGVVVLLSTSCRKIERVRRNNADRFAEYLYLYLYCSIRLVPGLECNVAGNDAADDKVGKRDKDCYNNKDM